MLSLIVFLIVLGVLVLVHEFGHFIVAKRLGVRVEKFSLGFGPKIWSVKKGETEYLVSSIPLGGYVKMSGEDPTEPLKNEKWEFLSKSVSDRFKIIFAGPALNYLFAFLIFSVVFMFGSPVNTTEIGGLISGYPAEKSGICAGDKILAVDGKEVKYWEEMTEAIRKHTSGPAKLSIERNGKVFETDILPLVRQTKDIFGSDVRIAQIGIAPSKKIGKERYGFFKSFYMGFKQLMKLSAMTYKSLWAMVTGRMSAREMTGPIGIFVITGEAAKLGLAPLLLFMGLLSMSLAIFNLLPLPILDGGHIFFLALEKIMGRPLSAKTQETITNIGFGLLMILIVFIFYNDIMRFGVAGKVMKLFRR